MPEDYSPLGDAQSVAAALMGQRAHEANRGAYPAPPVVDLGVRPTQGYYPGVAGTLSVGPFSVEGHREFSPYGAGWSARAGVRGRF